MNYELLIADSGSTKTDWAVGALRIKTQGINPFHQDVATISRILNEELLPRLDNHHSGVKSIRFYGSGVRPELQTVMEELLHSAFPAATDIQARSDLFGAARALCGRHEGIACILGTGANSCLFDGNQIVANTPPLGYILGDEGSGAVLGQRFLTALYRKELGEDLLLQFENWAGMNLSSIIDRVYRRPMANRWLASLAPFIHDHLSNAALQSLVVSNFSDFIVHHVNPYNRHDLPLSAVGSIAFFFRSQLMQAARVEGYSLGTILKSPIDGLANPTLTHS